MCCSWIVQLRGIQMDTVIYCHWLWQFYSNGKIMMDNQIWDTLFPDKPDAFTNTCALWGDFGRVSLLFQSQRPIDDLTSHIRTKSRKLGELPSKPQDQRSHPLYIYMIIYMYQNCWGNTVDKIVLAPRVLWYHEASVETAAVWRGLSMS